MGRLIIVLLVILLGFTACGSGNAVLFNRKVKSKKSAPSGKYRNPTLFSRVNPFQGRAKARLTKSKKSKFKLLKRKHKQKGRYRKAPKPGRRFKMKRTLSRGRLKSSGSRMKSGGGKQRKNKNLFNTRK